VLPEGTWNENTRYVLGKAGESNRISSLTVKGGPFRVVMLVSHEFIGPPSFSRLYSILYIMNTACF
jgi:hypothetical protein